MPYYFTIGNEDFQVADLALAWQGTQQCTLVSGGSVPDFSRVMSAMR